jgi:hypothetical protein
MSSLGVYLCPKCSEPLEKPDHEQDELVCPGCGIAFTDPETKRLKFVPEGSAIDSPGMAHPLGTDQRQLIREFHGLGRKNGDAEKKPDGFMLSLHDLWDGGDETFWIRLTEALKDRDIPEEKIALACAAVRHEIRYLKRKKAEELAEILRRFGIQA